MAAVAQALKRVFLVPSKQSLFVLVLHPLVSGMKWSKGEPRRGSRRLTGPLMEITLVFLRLKMEVGRRGKEVVQVGEKAEIT